MTILHASDLHFGKPHLPVVAEALLRFIRRERPAAVVISGDLTQRAKAREYRAARDFLSRLAPIPLVVTAGNHDVPLYRVWERIFAPYRNYRAHISDRLDTVLDVHGGDDHPALRFVALNSSAPHSAIVNGHLRDRQLDFAATSFAQAPPGATRVFVVHHNLLRTQDGEPVPPLPQARQVLQQAREWGVDLVLAGHIHCSHLSWSEGTPSRGEVTPKGPRKSTVSGAFPVVMAGTASSNRGRASEKGRNSVNLVGVDRYGIDVTVYLYSEDADRFLPEKSRRFSRRA